MADRVGLPPIPLRTSAPWGYVPPPEECGEGLLDVTDLDRRIVYGGAYHKQGLPGAPERCYLRAGVWERLVRAVDSLPQGYGIYIFDALRPLSVQQGLYDLFAARFRAQRPGISHEELAALLDDFVAKPVKNLARPAPHATGGAVDLTLTYGGRLLDMGTDFDETDDRAFLDYFERHPQENPVARDNRRLLYHTMLSAGFSSYECEWWHYAYGERMWAKDNGETPFYGFVSDRLEDYLEEGGPR